MGMIFKVYACLKFVEGPFFFLAVGVISRLTFFWRFDFKSVLSKFDVAFFWRHHFLSKLVDWAVIFFRSI